MCAHFVCIPLVLHLESIISIIYCKQILHCPTSQSTPSLYLCSRLVREAGCTCARGGTILGVQVHESAEPIHDHNAPKILIFLGRQEFQCQWRLGRCIRTEKANERQHES